MVPDPVRTEQSSQPIELELMSKFLSSIENAPSSVGMDPVSLLDFKSKLLVISESKPNSVGIVLEKPLESSELIPSPRRK